MKSDPGATFASGSFSFAVSRRLFFLRKVLNRQGKLVGSERDFSKISFFQKELFSLHLEIPCKTSTSKLSTVKPSSSSCIMKEDNQVGV
jgi:hypothetical protein